MLLPRGTRYEITGVLTNGRTRFKIHTNSFMYARGINLYRGTRWFILPGETKRRVWERVWN